MRKKKGYHLLLGVTITFTLISIVLVVLTQMHSSIIGSYPMNKKLILIFIPFVAAGVTCALRKKLFTEE